MKPLHHLSALLKAVDSTVINYRTDLDHDKKLIAANPGTPFIHAARPNGTHIVFMTPADSPAFPPPGVHVPYLFATADRHHILKGKRVQVEWFAENSEVIHEFDGRALHAVSPAAAVRTIREYCDRIQAEWAIPRKLAYS